MKKTFILITAIIISSASFACCINSGDPNSLNAENSAVLPITMKDFKGEFTSQQEVDLSWITMMESDVDHFEIQRSGDGMQFQNIASVASKMKISTSDYQLQYNSTDPNPLPGISYYKIKIIGRNGSSNQSPVIQINNSDLVNGTKIYPTLIQNNIVFVESDKNLRGVRMEFFDLSGKKISETDWDSFYGRQSASVSNSGTLPTGTYLARLTANGQLVKSQLVIVQSH
jgi:trimeric autotransporter adhesin